MPWDPFVPYAVPGLVVLVDPDRAEFIADVNGAVLSLHRLPFAPDPQGACV